MFVQVLVLVAATHSATPCGDVYSPHQQWGSALSAIQESTFVRFPSPAPNSSLLKSTKLNFLLINQQL